MGTTKLRLIWNEPSFPTKILNGMLHNTHSIWGESQHSVAKSTNMLNFVSEYVKQDKSLPNFFRNKKNA